MPSKMRVSRELQRVVDVIKAGDGMTPSQAMAEAGVHLSHIGRKLRSWQLSNADIEMNSVGEWMLRKPTSNIAAPRSAENKPLGGYNLMRNVLRDGALDYRKIPTRYI